MSLPYALVGTIVTVFITVGTAWVNLKGDVTELRTHRENDYEAFKELKKDVSDLKDNISGIRVDMATLSTLLRMSEH